MEKSNQKLGLALRNMVLQECRVQGVTATEIPDDEPVVGGQGKIQLDSLDAVEIVTSLERNFGLKAEGMGPLKNIFSSYRNLTDFVSKNAPTERVENFVTRYS